jgi:hypothetical protein
MQNVNPINDNKVKNQECKILISSTLYQHYQNNHLYAKNTNYVTQSNLLNAEIEHQMR